MNTYKIIRFYANEKKSSRTIARGLSLKEAQAHCSREDTHKKDASGNVIWFDGYNQE